MNRVAKNAMWIIICRIVQSVLALVLNMLVARFLGPSNFGIITYASSLVAFVVPIMQLGLNNILVQELVNDPKSEGKILGTSIGLSLLSSFFCIIGLSIFVLFIHKDDFVTILVCILYSLILVFQAIDYIEYWYQSKLLSKYISIISLIAYSLVSVYRIFLLVNGKSVYWFALANALDYLIISSLGIILYIRLGGNRLSFSGKLAKKLFSKSKHYILSAMMVTMFAQTDKIMINLMIDETNTGYYGAAVSCAGMTGFVFTAIIDSFRPTIFEGYKISMPTFERRLKILYSIIIYFSLLQSIIITIFSKLIIYILYGSDYMIASSCLSIIVWYTTFSYVGAIRDIWLLANDLQRYLWKINLMGALLNVVLNYFLIRIVGINGAAIASLITQIFTNVGLGFLIKPLCHNNELMLASLNIKYLKSAIHGLLKRDYN
ncbi:flippase [Faecalitalea cylindroides]|uniref:flippase n=1 Tax=Faecalitalea cylindroides TaxID=39483 RepID=UPI0039F56AF9